MDAAVDRFGRLDVVVANAGVAADGGPMAELLPDALFEETVRVGLTAAVQTVTDGHGEPVHRGARLR